MNRGRIKWLVREALNEDLGVPHNDKTSNLLKLSGTAKAKIIIKEQAIVCGLDIAKECFLQLPGKVKFQKQAQDGDKVEKETVIAFLEGSATTLLMGERTALNFLQRLSGIATLTHKFVSVASKYGASVLDTRKTTPLLRDIEKYAVIRGGGSNHRMGLFDGVLIKDNHIKLLGIEKAVKQAIKRASPDSYDNILLEAENIKQVDRGYALGIRRFLLDNMSCRKIIEIREKYPEAYLEVSGGINLENIEEIAACGVNSVSIGMITHSAKSIDISMELI